MTCNHAHVKWNYIRSLDRIDTWHQIKWGRGEGYLGPPFLRMVGVGGRGGVGVGGGIPGLAARIY